VNNRVRRHTVVRGDTLWGIARQYGVRHWPNIFLADCNTDFIQLRSDPSHIRPGDVIGIPPSDEIAPMEARPNQVHRDFPIFWPQATSHTCWRACGFMVWARKHRISNTATAQTRFTRILGSHYNNLTGGLPWTLAREVYVSRLGLREHTISCINDINRTVAVHGPAIIAFHDSASGHAVIIAGYDIMHGDWIIVDPLSGSVTNLDFADSSRDTHQPGTGTWDGLSRTRGFFEGSNIQPTVYTA